MEARGQGRQFLDTRSANSVQSFNRSIGRATSGEGGRRKLQASKRRAGPVHPADTRSPEPLPSHIRGVAAAARLLARPVLRRELPRPALRETPPTSVACPSLLHSRVLFDLALGSPRSHASTQAASLRARLPTATTADAPLLSSPLLLPSTHNRPVLALGPPRQPARPVLTRPTFRTTQRHVTRTTLDMMSIP